MNRLRPRARLTGLILLGALVLALLAGCGAEATTATPISTESANTEGGRAITLGDIDPDEPTKKVKRFQPLADYLAEHLASFGIGEGRVVIARDIEEMGLFTNEGTVDLFFDSPFPTLAVQGLSGSDVILRRWKDQEPIYWSMYITLRDSGVKAVEDFVGKVLAFEEPRSTSGFLLPAGTLAQRGFTLRELGRPDVQVAPDEIGYYFSGDEENTIQLLLEGQVAGGGISNQDYDELPPELREQIIVLDRTISVPRQLVSARPDLESELVEEIIRLLIDLENTAEGRELMDGLKKTTKFDFLPADSEEALAELKELMSLMSR